MVNQLSLISLQMRENRWEAFFSHMDAHVDGSIVDIDVEMVDLRLVDAVVAPI